MDVATIKELFGWGQVGGLAWLIWRIGRMEHMMGNGSPGVFIRRKELELMKDAADKDHGRFDDEFKRLWDAIDQVRKIPIRATRSFRDSE